MSEELLGPETEANSEERLLTVKALGTLDSHLKATQDYNANKSNKGIVRPKPFLSYFVGKKVLIQLLNKQELIGVLISNNYNKYEVLLRQGSRLYLVPKHAIAYIQLREPIHKHPRR